MYICVTNELSIWNGWVTTSKLYNFWWVDVTKINTRHLYQNLNNVPNFLKISEKTPEQFLIFIIWTKKSKATRKMKSRRIHKQSNKQVNNQEKFYRSRHFYYYFSTMHILRQPNFDSLMRGEILWLNINEPVSHFQPSRSQVTSYWGLALKTVQATGWVQPTT